MAEPTRAPGDAPVPDAAPVDRLTPAMLERVAARTTGARAAAFFDLDKTILAGSSALLMSRTFFRDGLISSTMVVRSLYAQLLYQLVGADHAQMEQMRDTALELTRGWPADRVRELARDTLESVLVPLVHAEALALIEDHRRAGRDVWIVSTSGEEIVEPLAEHLGIDDVIATRSNIDAEGRYDGTVGFYAYAGAKANAIREVAAVRGYDLDECWAYSDSITDLPMLSVVGHPVAVNPDRELRSAALAMGWPTMDLTSPVRLRDRLPDVPTPSRSVMAGAGVTVVGIATALWWTRSLRTKGARRA
jgi:HAD superfamily hydrolase (TIGR01490 family)